MALNRPPGPTEPAVPGAVDRGGREARGKVVAGLGLELLRIAIPMLGATEDGVAVTEVVAKLGKRFSKPAEDLGQAELKFMGSTLYPQPQGNVLRQGPMIRQRLAQAGLPGAMPAPEATGG